MEPIDAIRNEECQKMMDLLLEHWAEELNSLLLDATIHGEFTVMSLWEAPPDWYYGTGIKELPNSTKVSRRCADKEHVWTDTGFSLTWCKKCDITGRIENGSVIIINEEESKDGNPRNNSYSEWGTF